MNKKQQINQYFINKVNEYFGNNNSIIILYGSTANQAEITGDYDCCIILEKYTADDKTFIVNLIREINNLFQLKIDEQVPHENKTIFLLAEVSKVIEKPNFFNIRNYKIKELPEDLFSIEMKERLLFNILTTNHEFLQGNIDELVTKAWHQFTLILLITANKQWVSINELIEMICYSTETKRSYKEYLGFSNEKHREYLVAKLKIVIKELVNLEKVQVEGGLITLINPYLLSSSQIECQLAIVMNQIASQFKDVALKGSYTYKYYTDLFEREISDIDLIILDGTLVEKIDYANQIMLSLAPANLVYQVLGGIFQSVCVLVGTPNSNDLIKVTVELLANTKPVKLEDINLIKLNNGIELKVMKLEKLFIEKLVALIRFFSKTYQDLDKKIIALYDLGILMQHEQIIELLEQQTTLLELIKAKLIDDYEVQTTELGYYLNSRELIDNNLDQEMISNEIQEQYNNYIKKENYRFAMNSKEVFKKITNLMDYIKVLLETINFE